MNQLSDFLVHIKIVLLLTQKTMLGVGDKPHVEKWVQKLLTFQGQEKWHGR